MTSRFISYPRAFQRFDRAYWRVLAQCPQATSYRQAALLAGVTVGTAWRKLKQYRLRLIHGRR